MKIEADQVYKVILASLEMRVINGKFHIKEGTYWKPITDRELAIKVCSLIPKDMLPYLSNGVLHEAIKRLKMNPDLQLTFTDEVSERFIYLQNGVYDTEKEKLIPLTEDLNFSTVLDFSYYEGCFIQQAKSFMQFVDSVFPDETELKMKQLLQILAYCMSEYCMAKTAFFLIGVSNSGKSTILDFLKMLYPAKVVAAIPLNRLENRFNLASLDGKKINICTELAENSLCAIDIFKQMTANEMVTAEHKGRDPFEFRLKCKSINAGNMIPSIDKLEGMDAVLNRMTILYFPVSIPKEKQDMYLLDKLFEERDIICSCALKELKNLKDNNFMFLEATDAKQLKEQLRARGRAFDDFIADMCEIRTDAKVHNCDLFDSFQRYCADNLLDIKISKTQFVQRVSSLPGIVRKKMRIGGSSPKWGVEGIGLINTLMYDNGQDSVM